MEGPSQRDYATAKSRLLDKSRYSKHWGNADTILIQFITPYDHTQPNKQILLAVTNIITAAGMEAEVTHVDMKGTVGISMNRALISKLQRFLTTKFDEKTMQRMASSYSGRPRVKE